MLYFKEASGRGVGGLEILVLLLLLMEEQSALVQQDSRERLHMQPL